MYSGKTLLSTSPSKRAPIKSRLARRSLSASSMKKAPLWWYLLRYAACPRPASRSSFCRAKKSRSSASLSSLVRLRRRSISSSSFSRAIMALRSRFRRCSSRKRHARVSAGGSIPSVSSTRASAGRSSSSSHDFLPARRAAVSLSIVVLIIDSASAKRRAAVWSVWCDEDISGAGVSFSMSG